MWYHCIECGHFFEDGEERSFDDVLDMIDEMPYTERHDCCPICGGEFEEAETCRRCGCAFAPEDLIARLYCRNCLEELLTEKNMKAYIEEDLENFAEWIYDWEV